MTLHELIDAPPPDLAAALADYESSITYPLGPERSFRISHGEDYPRFYRSIGGRAARSFILTSRGQVRGVLGAAVRPLLMPDGTTRMAAYIGDIKAVGGRQLVQLTAAADQWARPQVTAAYGVVMDGTRTLPTHYTGRVGIQRFNRLAQICILRLSTGAAEDQKMCVITDAATGQAHHRELNAGRIAPLGGDPDERSQTPPTWLLHNEGQACGRVEDTRRAKRLVSSPDNVEMLAAHLACFAFRTYRAAAELIHAARAVARERGFPALFVSVASHELDSITAGIGTVDTIIAPATIYGVALESIAAPWSVNTSEI